MLSVSKIVPPVFPYRGFRGVDSWGVGSFGASRDSGKRQHPGVDFLALPGDAEIAPITGKIVRVGIAKTGTTLGSIHIEGVGDFKGLYVKLFYGQPNVTLGTIVQQGDTIGTVQNVADWYHTHTVDRPKGPMKNHIHMEMRFFVDPTKFLPAGLPANPMVL